MQYVQKKYSRTITLKKKVAICLPGLFSSYVWTASFTLAEK